MKSKQELEDLKKDLAALIKQRAELSEEELAQVNGGLFYKQLSFPDEQSVKFVFKVGDIVEVDAPFWFGTVRCRITAVKTVPYREVITTSVGVPDTFVFENGYTDSYYCKETSYHWHFRNGWYTRDKIEVPGT